MPMEMVELHGGLKASNVFIVPEYTTLNMIFSVTNYNCLAHSDGGEVPKIVLLLTRSNSNPI